MPLKRGGIIIKGFKGNQASLKLKENNLLLASYVANACTTGSISSLGCHSDALDAMLAFCQCTIAVGSRYGFAAPGALESFYLFTAGPEEPGHAHSKRWVRYGTEFAAFILENKLGEIATLAPRLNLKYHPETTCQTWLWAPDQDALVTWYKRNKPRVNHA